MSARKRFALTLALLLVVNVAGLTWIYHRLARRPTAQLQVRQLLPETGLEETDRVSIVFDRDAAPPERLNQPLEHAPFKVEPAAPGQWTWTRPNQLDLVLARQLTAATEYTFHPTAVLETSTGRTLHGRGPWRLRTEPLALTAHTLVTNDPRAMEVTLHFNLPVDPAVLKDRARAHVPSRRNNPEAHLDIVTRGPSRTIKLLVHEAEHPVELVLDESLRATVGTLPLEGLHTLTLTPPETLELVRTWASTPDPDGTSTVELQFSRTLSGRGASGVTIKPAISDRAVRIVDNELRISGRFKPGDTYRITVPADLDTIDGRPLGQPVVALAIIDHCQPSVDFTFDSGCLSPRGNLQLDLSTVNTGSLHLEVQRVYPNNLVLYRKRTYGTRLTRTLARRTVALDVRPDTRQTMLVDLKSLVDNPHGLYIVTARSGDDRWRYDRAVVAVTDMALTTKQHPRGVLAWVTSLHDARPVEGATVEAWSGTNQRLARATTGPDGTAVLEVPSDHPDGRVFLVTAGKGDDVVFVEPGNRRWMVEGVTTAGGDHRTTGDVFLYTERGVHRPGETVHLTGIVRRHDGTTPGGLPLELRIIRPDGKQLSAEPIEVDHPQGVFHLHLPTSPEAMTGRYRYEVATPGATRPLGTAGTLLEAFMPIRMEVDLATADTLGPETPIEANLAGRYLFGLAAAGVPWQAEGSLDGVPFTSRRFADYRFGSPDERTRVALEPCSGTLDDKGTARLVFKPQQPVPPGFYRLRLSATLNEPGSRAALAHATAHLQRATRTVGLKVPDSHVLSPGQPIDVSYVQVTADDRPAEPVPLTATLQKVEYDWVVQRVNGRQVWKSKLRLIDATPPTVTPDPDQPWRGVLTTTLPAQGRYRLTVVDPVSKTRTACTLYARPGGQGTPGNEVPRGDRLEIVTEQDRYTPG
ncbi:MAG: MG2 domain-containing protein, partial [Planctomycetota bacterium]